MADITAPIVPQEPERFTLLEDELEASADESVSMMIDDLLDAERVGGLELSGCNAGL